MGNQKRSFRQLEQKLTVAVAADLAVFALYLISAGMGIGWLKVIGAVLCIGISALGSGFLCLIGEHKRQRSRWLLAAFGALLVCCVVSLICGYPCPSTVS